MAERNAQARLAQSPPHDVMRSRRVHRHHIATWVGPLLLALASTAAAAPTAGDGPPTEDPLTETLEQVRAKARDAILKLRGAMVATVVELRHSLGRAARLESSPFTGADGRRLSVEQLAFRLTQDGPYDQLISTESERRRVDPFLLKGLLLNESELNPTLVGRKRYAIVGGRRRVVSGGSVGIAQFSGSGMRGVTELRKRRAGRREAVDAFTREKALDPEQAIPAAAEVLSFYLSVYGRDGGVTAYNTGMSGGAMVRRYGFWRARSMGVLRRAGHIHLQGDYFLLNVLRRANRLRIRAGLPPMPPPDRRRRTPRPTEPTPPLTS